ncbi:MAG: hypothetical protein NC433_07650 [Clostridiales bacterium]|nr:hypothetical protein [Clostridiales bacterium]
MANSQSTILKESLPIFIREDLNDRGEHNCHNSSPDIVVQKFKINNPAVYLKDKYDFDISEASDDSGKMYIYVRFKNTSSQPVNDFYIHLYRNHLGLCNVPNDWAAYEMKTEDNSAAYIKSLGPGEIGVAPAFIYDKNNIGIHPNCFVAVATREKNPDYSSINTYDKYVEWINKTNVAARNVSVILRPTHRHEQILHFQNPNKESAALIGFQVKLSDASTLGIRYGIKEDTLGVDESKTYYADDEDSDYIFHAVRLPAGYSGKLMAWHEILGNGKANIDVIFWYLDTYNSSSILAQYGIELDKKFSNISGIESISLKPRKAIMLGACHLKIGT